MISGNTKLTKWVINAHKQGVVDNAFVCDFLSKKIKHKIYQIARIEINKPLGYIKFGLPKDYIAITIDQIKQVDKLLTPKKRFDEFSTALLGYPVYFDNRIEEKYSGKNGGGIFDIPPPV